MSEFIKGLVCLGITVVLFLIADYFNINSFKELF